MSPAPHPSMPPLDRLRDAYARHLASPAIGRQGAVAGKQTRRGLRQGQAWQQDTATAWQGLASAYARAPGTVWVWSDLHLGHANIIGYAGRPHGNVWHMDHSLLAAAQGCVAADDWLLFVGDLAMWKDVPTREAWLAACPGQKALVLGNHDVRGPCHPESLRRWRELGFAAVADVAVLPAAHGLPELWVSHYPLPRTEIPRGVANLHGHLHARRLEGPYVSACVEHTDYRPQPLAQWAARSLGLPRTG